MKTTTPLPDWALTTEPHPTDSTKVLAPFNLDAAKAGVPIAWFYGGAPMIFHGATSKGRAIAEPNDGAGLAYSYDEEKLRLLLPAPPEGYELLDAGEKPIEPLMACCDGIAWHEVEFPTFAQFENGNIYARKLPAAEPQYTGEAHCIKCGKTHWLFGPCPVAEHEPTGSSGATVLTYNPDDVKFDETTKLKLRIMELESELPATPQGESPAIDKSVAAAGAPLDDDFDKSVREWFKGRPATIADVDARIARAFDKLAHEAEPSYPTLRMILVRVAAELRKEVGR